MIGWVYAFHPDLFKPHLFKKEALHDLQWLLGVAGITFLPIGYIISIIEQSVYLNWRRRLWGCPRIRRWLGFHGAALDNAVPTNQERDEPIIEARTLLLTASRNGPLSVDTHLYIRNWIARRADVCAINLSLIVATFLAGIVALVLYLKLLGDDTSWGAVGILAIISVFVILVTLCSYSTLRRQLIEVVAGIYRTYR